MFKKAERKKAKLRLAIAGPSGSGKTFSSLLIAKGLGGNIAVLDTENKSSELYADNPKIGIDFDVCPLKSPYHPDRYIEAMKYAQKTGYSTLIIDSASHAWMGEGGLLDLVDMAAKANRGNSMAGWKSVAPIEKRFIDALVQTDMHIIVTLRTKTEWDISKDERTGKTKPVKIGLKPEQRQGLEYEFTVVFDMAVEGNIATVSKDRTGLFSGRYFVPSEETGKEIVDWLNSGKAEEKEITFEDKLKKSGIDLETAYKYFVALSMEKGRSVKELKDRANANFESFVESMKKEIDKNG